MGKNNFQNQIGLDFQPVLSVLFLFVHCYSVKHSLLFNWRPTLWRLDKSVSHNWREIKFQKPIHWLDHKAKRKNVSFNRWFACTVDQLWGNVAVLVISSHTDWFRIRFLRFYCQNTFPEVDDYRSWAGNTFTRLKDYIVALQVIVYVAALVNVFQGICNLTKYFLPVLFCYLLLLCSFD